MQENQRLRKNDGQTRDGYISSPMCELKPINEVDTESNDKEEEYDVSGMEMRNYDVDKVRVKNHSTKLYQSENKTKPKNSIQTK